MGCANSKLLVLANAETCPAPGALLADPVLKIASQIEDVADLKLREWSDPTKFSAEPDRYAQLAGLGVLRTEPEGRFDSITKLMASIFKTPVALVSLLEESTLWMKSRSGEFPTCIGRDGSMCSLVLVPSVPEVIVVEDMLADARVAGNVFVAGPPHARFYAGAPLVGAGGMRYGTLCVVDVKPRRFPAEQLQMLINFAALVVREMERDSAARREALAPEAEALTCGLKEAREGVALVDVGDESWQVLYANDAWAEATGASVEECTQRGLWKLIRALTPDAAAAVQTALADGTPVQLSVTAAEAKPGAPPLTLTLRPASDTLSPEAIVGMPGFVAMGGPTVRDSSSSVSTVSTTVDGIPALWFAMLEAPEEEPAVPAAAARPLQPYGLARPERYSDLKLGPLLGAGSAGRVHRGVWGGRRVAVKILEVPIHGDGELRAALDEGILSKDITHPNIVATLDYAAWRQGESQDVVWIVQRYCDRGTLLDAVDRGWLRQGRTRKAPPDLGVILATAADVASAMVYLHARDVLHGDLSGGNVLLASSRSDPRGFRALLADFGLARVVTELERRTNSYGTISHMPPELLAEGVRTKGTDVYAFGVCLWEMYRGQRAWCGRRPAQIILEVTSGRGGLPLPDDAPQAFKDLVVACMAPVHGQRPTFEQVLKIIQDMQAALPAADGPAADAPAANGTAADAAAADDTAADVS